MFVLNLNENFRFYNLNFILKKKNILRMKISLSNYYYYFLNLNDISKFLEWKFLFQIWEISFVDVAMENFFLTHNDLKKKLKIFKIKILCLL